MPKTIQRLFWDQDDEGMFTPQYRWKGHKVQGVPRPFQRFLKGERLSVARYFMLLACEDLFGVAPLRVLGTVDDIQGFEDNPEWDRTPEMFEDKDAPCGWRLTNGNPDVMGMMGGGMDDQFFETEPEPQTND